ncbi:hypothetical protein [Streptacidiphilus sp. EB103A]|uniref:hypothetical protein n=1 Tax=Streptacidiphilus sp. EB103A TaxID=3156275 RepID=UPI003513A006
MPKPAPPHVTARVTALKDHVRHLLTLDEEDIVLIRQLACSEPGCPPLETVVAILPPDGTMRRWTLHHRVDDITPDLLATALALPPSTS